MFYFSLPLSPEHTVLMQETSQDISSIYATNCRYMSMSITVCHINVLAYAPEYTHFIGFFKGHTFHPHSAALQHPGHSYDFFLYFPRKSSGHLPILFMTPFHMSHVTGILRKRQTFLDDPIQIKYEEWNHMLIFLGCEYQACCCDFLILKDGGR